jgi:hypothetical protein
MFWTVRRQSAGHRIPARARSMIADKEQLRAPPGARYVRMADRSLLRSSAPAAKRERVDRPDGHATPGRPMRLLIALILLVAAARPAMPPCRYATRVPTP